MMALTGYKDKVDYISLRTNSIKAMMSFPLQEGDLSYQLSPLRI